MYTYMFTCPIKCLIIKRDTALHLNIYIYIYIYTNTKFKNSKIFFTYKISFSKLDMELQFKENYKF